MRPDIESESCKFEESVRLLRSWIESNYGSAERQQAYKEARAFLASIDAKEKPLTP